MTSFSSFCLELVASVAHGQGNCQRAAAVHRGSSEWDRGAAQGTSPGLKRTEPAQRVVQCFAANLEQPFAKAGPILRFLRYQSFLSLPSPLLLPTHFYSLWP